MTEDEHDKCYVCKECIDILREQGASQERERIIKLLNEIIQALKEQNGK